MKCRICDTSSREIFTGRMLSKYDVRYYFCPNCNFLQTETPYWLSEAYKSAIGVTDTGILKRNHLFSKRASAIIRSFFDEEKKFLDYAGGYGIFVRLMRDSGFDFYWYDPYADNLFAKGFEYDGKQTIFLLTAFECFEHFTDPLSEIEKMFTISSNILFSTRLFYGEPPRPTDWWYYSLDSGQHISFYSIKTLQYLAEKFKLNLNTDNKAFHMLSAKKVSNFRFNLILKMSDAGIFDFKLSKQKSKTESDNEFLSQIKK